MAEGEQEQPQYHESAKQLVLDLLPSEYRERLLEEGAKAGLQHSDDAMWPMIGMVINAWAAAEAARASAGASAESAQEIKASFDRLNEAINEIPTKANQSVLEAGKTAAKEAESSIQGTTNDQIQRINKSIGDTVQKKLDASGNHLIEQIGNALGNALGKAKTEIDEYKQGKVKEFKGDLHEVADQVAAAEITKARNRSFMTGVGAVLLGVAFSVGGGYAWQIYVKHPMTFKQQVQATSSHCFYGNKNGKLYCRFAPQHQHHH